MLGTPPALILSQDQTLVCNLLSCRRVVGRTTIACFRSKGKRDGVTISQRVVTYLVRSLGLGPSHFSHDWHVQPSCQRTDPLPPERALSVQSRITEARARRSRPHKPACPRNLYKLRVCDDHCQPVAITGFPPVFHKGSSTVCVGTGL